MTPRKVDEHLDVTERIRQENRRRPRRDRIEDLLTYAVAFGPIVLALAASAYVLLT